MDSQAEVDALGATGCDRVKGILFVGRQDHDALGVTNLDALINITSVGGYLYVGGTSVTNLDGLANLTSVGDFLYLWSNTALTNLDGLANLTSVGGYLRIGGNNAALTNLDGLANLTSVGGYLDINSNNALTNLDGLANLTSVGGYLDISYNRALTNCEGVALLLGWPNGPPDDTVGGSITVENNGAGCNSVEQILAGSPPNAPTLTLQSKTSTSATLAITSNGDGSGPIDTYTAACEIPSQAVFSREAPNTFQLGEPTPESRQRLDENQNSTAVATIYRPAPSLSNAAVGDELTFLTPDGESHTSSVTRSEATRYGNWLLEADAEGTRVLAVVTSEGNFSASVETTTGRFQAQILDDQTAVYSSQDGQFIDNPFLDDAILPPKLDEDDESVSSPIIGELSNTPTVISVGVQYDNSTVSAYNEIALSEYLVAIANQSYQQAGVDIVFEIAGMRQYQPYISNSTLADTLYFISCGSTSCNPFTDTNQNVESWRNQVKADLIVQIVRYGVPSAGGTQCGVAFIPQQSSHFLSYLKALTFSVNALESRSGIACDNIVVAHEMGHNFGLGHDRYTSPDFTPYYSYARGYKNNSFGTVMSYTNDYILTLSNPYVTYGGQPTGVAIGQFGEAYAARAVENVMSLHEAIYSNSQPVYHTVSTSRGPNGSISPSSASVLEGATRSFTVVPDPDYAIDVISGCEGSLSGNVYTTGSIRGPCTISVTFKRSRWLVSGTSSPLVMSGLPTGDTFDCAATASNLAGPSPLSNLITFTTVAPAAPAKPSITQTDYGDGEIYLYVTASDGGASITRYNATCTDGTNFFTGTSTSSPITVSGLTNGVAYTCTVTATNSVGTSSASAATAPITPEESTDGLPIWLLYQATQ